MEDRVTSSSGGNEKVPGGANRWKIGCALGVVAIALLMVLFYPVALRAAGGFLVVEDKLEQSDAIIVINGEKGERVVEGVKLFKRGYADRLILSGGPVAWRTNSAEIMKKQVLYLGVPEDSIIIENKASTTYENAQYTKDVMKNRGLRSAVVVTSPYHTRRTKMIFERVYGEAGLRVKVRPVQSSWFNQDDWWAEEKGVKTVFLEYIKLLWYCLK